MKMIKLAVISAVVLFLLLTAMASLLPSHVRISRAINITATPVQVGALLKDGTRWPQWNEYVKALPDRTTTAGSIRSAKLSIVISPSASGTIETTWRQPNGKVFTSAFELIDRAPVTVVQWYFDFSFRWYPWEKFSSIVYDKQIGPSMQQSLDNLKELVENSR